MGMSKKPFAAWPHAALASRLAACGGDGDDDNSGCRVEAGRRQRGEATKGGTIFYNGSRNTEHLDPQRMYIGRDLTNSAGWSTAAWWPSRRTTTRRADAGRRPRHRHRPDHEDGGMSWSFTLKDGVKWEDGQPITCEDFKYGASRNFATDVIIGGPELPVHLPRHPDGDDGLPAYKGPYTGEGQDAFDKAVTCDGKHDHLPHEEAVAGLPAVDRAAALPRPVPPGPGQGRQDQLRDLLQRSVHARRRRGPRAPAARSSATTNWDESTDPIRKALPDKWEFREGDEDEAIYEQPVRRLAVTPSTA